MADALFSVEQLHLSLPDMTRKPLLGAAPRIQILKGVSFAIDEGAITGIVGESGSGKT
jgi:peptide/nickel transport system ATP-binding protein